mmetsp:Transcript_43512/g.69721  ORF Transcript_43512/g.69721 Transcript_43512/m.69721 type:complete len:252 (-) Transcript_43512:599-1354(-)
MTQILQLSLRRFISVCNLCIVAHSNVDIIVFYNRCLLRMVCRIDNNIRFWHLLLFLVVFARMSVRIDKRLLVLRCVNHHFIRTPIDFGDHIVIFDVYILFQSLDDFAVSFLNETVISIERVFVILIPVGQRQMVQISGIRVLQITEMPMPQIILLLAHFLLLGVQVRVQRLSQRQVLFLVFALRMMLACCMISVASLLAMDAFIPLFVLFTDAIQQPIELFLDFGIQRRVHFNSAVIVHLYVARRRMQRQL